MFFKKIIVLFLGILVISCTGNHLALRIEPTKVEKPSAVELAKSSTVAFIAEAQNEEKTIYPYCTGVWVNEDTILTAFHCAKGAAKLGKMNKSKSLFELFSQQKEDDSLIGTEMTYIVDKEVIGLGEKPVGTHLSKVMATDADHDLALVKALWVDKVTLPKHMALRPADKNPPVGSQVFTVGHVAGLYWTYTPAWVGAYRDKFFKDDDLEINGPYVQVVGAIWRGNSGGAVVDQDGNMIGIVSFIARAPNQAFAIGLDPINKLLASVQTKKN